MKYSTKKNPRLRTATIDFGRVSQRRHSIIGMIEVDVSNARKNIAKLKKETKLSFTGWLVKQITDLLAEHKQVAAYVKRKKTLYLFEDVTATVIIEKKLGTNPMLRAFIVPLILLCKALFLKKQS